MASDPKLFEKKALWIMPKLMADFQFTELDAAASVGNLGHESGGFKHFQELNPIVPGSRGGFGWAQWTGPRRKAFEAYCKRNNLDPYSDFANYAYLFIELTTTEKKTVPAVKAGKTLMEKVKAFELNFERAHPRYKHYDSRLKYAERALAAFRAAKPVTPVSTPVKEPTPAPEPTTVIVEHNGPGKKIAYGTGIAAIIISIITALAQFFGD